MFARLKAIIRSFYKGKAYSEIENSLLKKYKNKTDIKIELFYEDFVDGQLSYDGFEHIKQRAEMIENDEMLLVVPQRFQDGVSHRLEFFSSRELAHLKKERQKNYATAFILLFWGIVLTIFARVWSTYRGENVWSDIVSIFAWVCVWATAEQLIFVRYELLSKRNNILKILTARIQLAKLEEIDVA